MSKITLIGIRSILNNEDTIFMKKGHGKAVHVSVGAVLNNNLLCGVTYSRSGNRSSAIRPMTGYIEMDTEWMCKNCVKAIQDAIEPVSVGA
jgi:hypothetical protein